MQCADIFHLKAPPLTPPDPTLSASSLPLHAVRRHLLPQGASPNPTLPTLSASSLPSQPTCPIKVVLTTSQVCMVSVSGSTPACSAQTSSTSRCLHYSYPPYPVIVISPQPAHLPHMNCSHSKSSVPGVSGPAHVKKPQGLSSSLKSDPVAPSVLPRPRLLTCMQILLMEVSSKSRVLIHTLQVRHSS